MELRVLQYFLTLAREESITAAAEFLHVTQPTLSRQLMDLEAELGAKLFIRGSRKITLTEEGRLLRKRAEEIAELVHKTEEAFHTGDEMIGGDIYIGGGETHAMGIIARVIGELQREHPDITVHLHSGNAEDVTERLDKGLLDFGILIGPTDVTRYDSIRLPATDVWGVLMRKDSPLAVRDVIRPEDLWEVPLISSHQRLVDKELSQWMRRDYEKLNLVVTYNLIYNASLLVEAGVGYALTLDKLVRDADDSPLCFKPLEPRLESSLDMVWKKYQVFSRAAGVFLERMQMTINKVQAANKL